VCESRGGTQFASQFIAFRDRNTKVRTRFRQTKFGSPVNRSRSASPDGREAGATQMTSPTVLTAFALMVMSVGVSAIYVATPLFTIGLFPSISESTASPLDPVSLSAAYQARLIRAQERLAELGYDPGPADGVFRSQTAAAVRNFQRVQRLMITGRATPETLERLGIDVPPARLKRRPSTHPLGWVARDDQAAPIDQQKETQSP